MAEIGKINSFSRVGAVDRETPSSGHANTNTESNGRSNNAQLGRANAKTPEGRNAKVDEVAKLYEKQFLGEMMKAMRGTTNLSGEKTSMGEGIYRDQLDSQYVDSWGEQGGIGLSDLIYDQMMERYFSGPGKNLKGEGGFKVTDREIAKINRVATAQASQVPLKIETQPSADGGPGKIQAPWKATVLANTQNLQGKTSVTLGHSGGLKSTLIFDGVASSGLEPGAVIEKGKTVGILSPDVNSFFLNLQQPPAAASGTAQNSEGADNAPTRDQTRGL